MSAAHRQNITLDPIVFNDFCKYAEKKGIKISTWINAKMQEFIEDEKMLEELKKNKK